MFGQQATGLDPDTVPGLPICLGFGRLFSQALLINRSSISRCLILPGFQASPSAPLLYISTLAILSPSLATGNWYGPQQMSCPRFRELNSGAWLKSDFCEYEESRSRPLEITHVGRRRRPPWLRVCVRLHSTGSRRIWCQWMGYHAQLGASVNLHGTVRFAQSCSPGWRPRNGRICAGLRCTPYGLWELVAPSLWVRCCTGRDG
jgi:hypothetical protein